MKRQGRLLRLGPVEGSPADRGSISGKLSQPPSKAPTSPVGDLCLVKQRHISLPRQVHQQNPEEPQTVTVRELGRTTEPQMDTKPLCHLHPPCWRRNSLAPDEEVQWSLAPVAIPQSGASARGGCLRCQEVPLFLHRHIQSFGPPRNPQGLPWERWFSGERYGDFLIRSIRHIQQTQGRRNNFTQCSRDTSSPGRGCVSSNSGQWSARSRRQGGTGLCETDARAFFPPGRV